MKNRVAMCMMIIGVVGISFFSFRLLTVGIGGSHDSPVKTNEEGNGNFIVDFFDRFNETKVQIEAAKKEHEQKIKEFEKEYEETKEQIEASKKENEQKSEELKKEYEETKALIEAAQKEHEQKIKEFEKEYEETKAQIEAAKKEQ